MSNWILTKGLQNLRAQVDATFPDRDRTSDGTIGDAAHQAETSGHNPDDTSGSRPEWNGDSDSTPEVRAWDMDSDLAPGFNCQVFVDHVRSLPGIASVIRYLIYDRKIYHSDNGFRAATYTGASPHTEHVHFSGAYSQAADNNTTFNYRLEEIPVALTSADKSWLIGQLNAPYDDASTDAIPETPVGHWVLSQGIPDGTRAGARDAAWRVIEHLGEVLLDLQKQVADLATKLPSKP